MMQYDRNDVIHFMCDECDKHLNSRTKTWKDAVEVLRQMGWTAMPQTYGSWKHRCMNCRAKRAG